ncbi:LytR/AlgR family response regulator transcription factor [Flavihumibacter solisilvae]|uniref:LytTR family transcriptional regulator n=1 Tax=Flavihumibacter solisilvae TaxID=1349421 RepID=A0A0C1INQ9_9BACT|nr:LytTR family DNA-binding domain-containing protein [Flavihumibacter solisilvae]KIC95880.1 hypothetical protein OI18_04095 [Flavihumibacter solisilvae]
MKVLIVEDENLLAKQLADLMRIVAPRSQVVGRTNSIRSTVNWLQTNEPPDLLLMDIELADGQCFEIFSQTNCKVPVIFTTAYDEYTLRAFKLNSIDYLLKPVREEELRSAIDKYSELHGNNREIIAENLLSLLGKAGLTASMNYRERFLVRHGQKMMPVNVSQVAYFLSSNKLTFIITREKQKYVVDHTLDEIEKMLDPGQFFRASRQLIIVHDIVQSVTSWFKGRLKISVSIPLDEEVIVSREKAAAFREWLGGN